MKYPRKNLLLLGICLGLLCHSACAGEPAPPQTFPKSWTKLISRGDELLARPIETVIDKPAPPPGGDKHDFWTLAPYFWPNPDTPDGLPWINRDGEVNPATESPAYDRIRYFAMADAITTTALLYRHTKDDRYAECAARWARAWFVTPDTRMRPSFRFGHGVPGRVDGSAEGIIRGMSLLDINEALAWLEGSPHWSPQDAAAWRAWTCEYLDWMLTSDIGQKEDRAFNNHGTWYDVQAVTFARACGRDAEAKAGLHAALDRRIKRQIKPDGRQPMELLRTKSWDYSVMNLKGMAALAKLGESMEVDLWGYATPEGASITKAIDYLLPFALGKQPWTGKQIKDFDPLSLYPVIRAAAKAHPTDVIEAAEAQLRLDAEPVAMEWFRHPE